MLTPFQISQMEKGWDESSSGHWILQLLYEMELCESAGSTLSTSVLTNLMPPDVLRNSTLPKQMKKAMTLYMVVL